MTAALPERTPPARWYLDGEVLHREAERVFGRAWLWAGLAEDAAAPGCYTATPFLQRRHLVVRGSDGVLRAFHNVCRHHAARLLDGAGRCERVVCPYHGWEYDLQGKLRRAPGAGMADLDRDVMGLVPLAVGTLGPLLLVCGDRSASLAGLASLLPRLRLEGLRHVAQRSYRLRCNWKVFVDNYLDGGYHVPVAHRGLGEQLSLRHYRTDLLPAGSVQSCPGSGAGGGEGDFAERIGAEALYLWLYPALMLNRYGPVLDTNVVVPLGAAETEVRFDWWLEEPHAGDADFVARCVAQSDRVQQEDGDLCERVQDGLASGAFDVGPYAAPELPMRHFHAMLARDLGAA